MSTTVDRAPCTAHDGQEHAHTDLLGATVPLKQRSPEERQARTRDLWAAIERRIERQCMRELQVGVVVHLAVAGLTQTGHEVLATYVVDDDPKFSSAEIVTWDLAGGRHTRLVPYAAIDKIVQPEFARHAFSRVHWAHRYSEMAAGREPLAPFMR